MGGYLHVIGLGPAGLDSMTLGDYALLQRSNKIFLRTLNHPAAQELLQQGFRLESFDGLYQNDSFELVYAQMVQHLKKALDVYPEVVYAVPGHPMVAEKSVRLLKEELSADYHIVVHSGQSFLDEIFTALGFDPIEGVLVRNYDALQSFDLTGKDWLVVPQLYSRFIAAEVKLDLMKIYPDDAEVYLVKALGTPEARVDKLPLYELDHEEKDHLTTLVVPPQPRITSWARLEEVVAALRAPDGCPWDKEQTHQSLKPFLIEEAYEVLEAIDKEDMYNLCEELGDLLLQIFLHTQIAAEEKNFTLSDVVKGITDKMIRRHPHVFGSLSLQSSAEVLQTWDEIKKAEKKEAGLRAELFKGASALPALMLAADTQKRAGKYGFDWSDLAGPLDKVQEEWGELQAALAKGVGVEEEFGDLLFSLVNVSRFLQLDPEETLRKAVVKFQVRFEKMLQLAAQKGLNLNILNLDDMDILWNEVKSGEKKD